MMKNIKKIIRKTKTDSPIEEALYQELLEYGIEPECQYPVFPFFLDMAYPDIMLAIEADGKDYHTSKKHKERDKYRQDKLERLGWRFERFQGWFLKRHPKVAAAKIATRYFINKLSDEQKKNAVGLIAQFFASRDLEFTTRLLDNFDLENFKS